jgi:probable rRNA maturation factor
LENVEPPSPPDIIEKICLRVLNILEKENTELSVLLCDDNRIRELNRSYRNRDTATDVLSFSQEGFDNEADDLLSRGLPVDDSLENKPHAAGDIVISVDTLRTNAARYKESEIYELQRLLIHGILHLFGMEHDANNPDDKMLSLQDKILEDLAKEKMF